MQPIKPDQVTAQSLQAGQWQELLPEFYQLKTVEENSSWHDHQNVFDHVVKVVKSLESVLSGTQPVSDNFPLLVEKLNQPFASKTRKQLLILATLLHDIAKPTTVRELEGGIKACPGHEEAGAAMVSSFATRFGLTPAETARVEKIVRYHGQLHDALSKILAAAPESADEIFATEIEPYQEIVLELLLLMYADVMGSDLQASNSDEYDQRLTLITQRINKLLVS
jgi:UTP:GlnB (protein PII) uridylyltransferase